jgi:hypothetical protein
MVSLGERLEQAAQDLAGAQSDTQRQIRAHGLAPTLRALDDAGPSVVKLVHALRTSIAGGAAVSDTLALAQALKEAGAILSTWGQDDSGSIERRLGPICAAIRSLEERPVVEAPTAPAAPVVEPAAAAPAEAEDRPVATTAESVAPAPPAGEDWLARSFDSFRELTAAGGNSTTLGRLFGEPVAAPESASEMAPITDFCYSGPAALRQAMALKEQIQEGLPEDRQDLLQEIFDLVELGLQETN